jgi:release factor glutamine methyltransferase
MEGRAGKPDGAPESGIESEVYEPAEDSFLLLRAAEGARGKVLDLCSGSGIIGLSAARSADSVLMVDINPRAVSQIRDEMARRGLKNCRAEVSDLYGAVGDEKFDLIFANPPYLPCECRGGECRELHSCGGEHGYEITLRIIEGLNDHLSKGGKAFVITSTAYDVGVVLKAISDEGLACRKAGSEKFFFEELGLLEIRSGGVQSAAARQGY